MTLADLDAFGAADLRRRLLRGGLPSFFLAEGPVDATFQEWVDATGRGTSRAVRARTAVRVREAAGVADGAERGHLRGQRAGAPVRGQPDHVTNYAAVLEATFVIHLVRPYVGGGAAEIVAAPRAYGFDTGFVCFFKGGTRCGPTTWDVVGALRPQRAVRTPWAGPGPLLAHQARSEVDFVLDRRGRLPSPSSASGRPTSSNRPACSPPQSVPGREQLRGGQRRPAPLLEAGARRSRGLRPAGRPAHGRGSVVAISGAVGGRRPNAWL